MSRYTVIADARHHSEHMGLVGALATAREAAQARPGVTFDVERDGEVVGRYSVRGGRLEAWIR